MSPQSTKDRLRSYLVKHPGATAADAARALGVTRQRIHRIAQDEGLELAKYVSAPAAVSDLGASIAPMAFTGEATVKSDAEERAAKLRVAADLAARGYEVYFPSDASAFDLVAHDSGTGRFEGFTVTSIRPKSVRYDDMNAGRRTAIVSAKGEILYRPAFSA